MHDLTEIKERVSDFVDPITDQVAIDLSAYMDRFSNKSYGIRYLSRETGLHEKTIKRLLEKKNRPTYQTIAKLYFLFHSTEDYKTLLAQCPGVIKDYLLKTTPQNAIPKSSQKSDQFAEFLKRDPLVAEIFVVAGTGPVDQEQIRYLYGQYGLQALEQLVNEKILWEFEKGQYKLAANTPSLNGDSLKFLGEHFTRRYCVPQEVMSENNISFYAEGLNEEGLKAWLAIDTESFYRKLKIAEDKKYLGTKRVFTFVVTDTISPEKK